MIIPYLAFLFVLSCQATKNAAQYRESGNLHIDSKNYAVAIADLTKAIELNPADSDATSQKKDK